MPVLPAVGEREARGVAEATRRAVDHLRHQRQRADGACADPGNEQQIGEVRGATFGGGGEGGVEPAVDDILGPHLVTIGQDEMREQRLGRGRCALLAVEPRQFACDSGGADIGEQLELTIARCRGAAIGQIDDPPLMMPLDRGVRGVDVALQTLRQPMIAARLPPIAVHALLDDDPAAVVGDDEAVEVEIEPVLHRGIVDLRHQPADPAERCTVDPGAIADRRELLRGRAAVPAAAAADVDAEFAR